MRRFKFTLQALLTLRQQLEQNALAQYGEALLGRQQAIERLNEIEHEIALARADWMARTANGFSGPQAIEFQRYNVVLTDRRKQSITNVSVMERVVNQKLQAMMLARQEREVVEKFLERQKAAHQLALNRDEQKLLDDLASRARTSLLTWKGDVSL